MNTSKASEWGCPARRPITAYGLTLAAVAAASAARWVLDPWLGDHLPFVTFFVAVVAAAWLGGWRSALLATGLGLVLAWYLFVPIRYSFEVQDSPQAVGLAMYLVVSLAFAGFGEALLIAQRRADLRRMSLQTTLASIGDAVICTDNDARITFLNAVAESVTGWTHEEAVGQPLEAVFRIVNEKTRQKVENPVIRALREGIIVGLANHTVLIRKDGSDRPIDDSAAPIKDERGQVAGCVLIFRDITERRQAERVLADAKAHAENIVDTIREPLLVLDRDLRVRSASRSYCQTFRVTLEQTQGVLLYELGNGQWNIPDLRKRLSELSGQNSRFDEYEVEHDFPAIGRRIMLLNARGMHREGGEADLILLAMEDVTDRRAFEKWNAERFVAARQLASIVESSEDAIITKSLDGIIQSWNAAATRLFGYTAEQAVGRHVSLLIPSERAEEEDLIIGRIRAGERVEHFDTVRVRSDDRPISVSLTISPIKDETGRVTGASKIARDISERKQNEVKLYGLMAELKDADRRKDEFLATLAHELRGPLAPLGNALGILKQADGDADLLKQARDTMERQLAQMVRLVDDLLDVSRITRNKIELRTNRVELASVVHQAVEVCRPLAERAGQEVTVDLPTEPIYLHADPVRLAQIFTNLLNNACKYTNAGGKIWFTARRQASEVVVSVKDTGTGIPADKLDSIFDMFTQVESSLDRSQGGLGIGLTLVKRLVELHEGSIEARSGGVDQGSEFIVRLPMLVEVPEAMSPTPAAVNAPAQAALRILVVDDNRDSALSLAMLLKITGNEMHTAHDGLAALEVAEKLRPDVVLLDIGLPKLNGHEVCRRIREQPWGKDMVLVALTGWGQAEDRRKSQEAGFNYHMVKPVDHAALMTFLAEMQTAKD